MPDNPEESRNSEAIKALWRELSILQSDIGFLKQKVVELSQPGPLPETPPAPPLPAPRVEPQALKKDSITCPKCATRCDSDSGFCDSCGASLPQQIAKKPESVIAQEEKAPVKVVQSQAKEAATPRAPAAPALEIDWERFLGVKLFAWLGGFALFLGVVFFVKYAIDRDLISPWVRVLIGFITGVGTIVGGLMLRRRGYRTTVETLCAAGIAILYADVYACRAFYGFFSTETAFFFMVLVTATSFLLSVRLDSRYVAVLGLVGGFLTPPLLSTGVDRPIALFSYIAILDAGLAAVSLTKRWGFLMAMAAGATLLMEVAWTDRFFAAHKAGMAMAIELGFCAFFLAAREWAQRLADDDPWQNWPAILMPILSMGFCAHMLSFNVLANRPGLVLSYLLLLNLPLVYLAFKREDFERPYMIGGLITFALLLYWTVDRLETDLLLWGLSYFLAFAVLHGALPPLLQQLRPSKTPFRWGYAAPLAMLLLVVISLSLHTAASFLVWPFVLLLGLLGIMAAAVLASLAAAMVAIGMVMACFAIWMFRLPDLAGLDPILLILAVFTLVFFAAGLLVSRKAFESIRLPTAPDLKGLDPAEVPALAALMPFFLLAMVCAKLPLNDPSEIFGFMVLLNILLAGLCVYRGLSSLSGLALFATVMVEVFWHVNHFNPARFTTPLAWYLGFFSFFAALPFVFAERMRGRAPWIAAALAGPAHFFLVYKVMTAAAGKAYIGIVPAFFALPALAGLWGVLTNFPPEDERRLDLLAVFGGVGLLFITLIIPIQFNKEWITLGWALEGAALVWLFRRVPHQGLKHWGAALLGIAFVRLAMNPAVLSYHARAATPLLNWYLFVYGTVILCLFFCAARLAPPEHEVLGFNAPPILNSLATVLCFLLLNIEIADYFSTGTAITFNFSGSFGQDMTYSLGWCAFAITLLTVGIHRRSSGARLASLALLSVTILKVFLHDLWRLGQLYRVASVVGLAVILILVSFLYQRFIVTDKREAAS
jgi:uncharacterized membrane protein